MKALNKKGQAGMIGSVVAIVTIVILLFISILLVSKVKASIDTDSFTTEENTTFDEVVSNSNTAFTLMAIALVVLVAFLIISILRG